MTDTKLTAQRFVYLINGRWTIAVLAQLGQRELRYQDLHDAISGISHKVLTETLRRMEQDGLVGRHLDPGRVETATLYQLTDIGRSLDQPLSTLADWVDSNWATVEAARRHWNERRRGTL